MGTQESSITSTSELARASGLTRRLEAAAASAATPTADTAADNTPPVTPTFAWAGTVTTSEAASKGLSAANCIEAACGKMSVNGESLSDIAAALLEDPDIAQVLQPRDPFQRAVALAMIAQVSKDPSIGTGGRNRMLLSLIDITGKDNLLPLYTLFPTKLAARKPVRAEPDPLQT